MNNYRYGSMPIMWRGTDRWVHDITLDKDAWERSVNRLEPAYSQSDVKPTPGIQNQPPERHNTVSLPLTWLHGVLLDLERALESFQLEALGR